MNSTAKNIIRKRIRSILSEIASTEKSTRGQIVFDFAKEILTSNLGPFTLSQIKAKDTSSLIQVSSDIASKIYIFSDQVFSDRYFIYDEPYNTWYAIWPKSNLSEEK